MATRQQNISKHVKYEYWWEHSWCKDCSVRKCARRMAPTYGVTGELSGVTTGCIDYTDRDGNQPFHSN